MEKGLVPTFQVSEFIAIVNQSLEMAFGMVEVEGEVASFTTSRQQYVFFDLKDANGAVNCFMMAWQLRMPIEDGMKVVARVLPKLTSKGKFSLTVQSIRPVGEGSLKKSFELLKAKLDKEGLFEYERKRPLPAMPEKVAVISSVEAAGYADFMKIAAQRSGGIKFSVANVKVQGDLAADQIIRAIRYFNQQAEIPEVIVIIRGGGSADDLSVFNDEALVRAIAASRVPILTGIGHETDESLSDLVSDVSAVTPSNAAQVLLTDRAVVIDSLTTRLRDARRQIFERIDHLEVEAKEQLERSLRSVVLRLDKSIIDLDGLDRTLRAVDPMVVLSRGYALVRGRVETGKLIEIETNKLLIKAEVKECHGK